MTLQYSLSENDYLQHQLYIASKSNRIKKQRIRSWIIVIIGFSCLAHISYKTNQTTGVYYFLTLAVIATFFYPLYLRRYYLKHYKKNVVEVYKNRFDKNIEIVFTENSIDCKDVSGETKIILSVIDKFIETNNYFYISINTGGHLIIPKLQLQDLSSTQSFLASLAQKLNINYNKELDWKWQ